MYDEDESAATHVYNPDDPVMGLEWSVNVSDEETRTMRAAEIAFEFLRGALDAEDSFVWRDGMDDWIPLGQCVELQEIIRQYQTGQGQAGQAEADFGSTVMMDTSAPQPNYQAYPSSQHEVSRTMASPPEYQPPSFNAPTQAFPPQPISSYGGDPFAGMSPAAASHPQDDKHRVGERHEESSLFSLKNLNVSPPPKSPPKERDPLEDIMNFGGGGGIASAFAPPPIHAPAPPPPPPPPVVQAVQAHAPLPPMAMPQAMLAAQLQPLRKSPLPMILGGAIAVLVIIGGVLGFLLTRDDGASAMATPSEASAEPGAKDDDAAREEEAEAKEASDEDGEKADEEKTDEEKAEVTPAKTSDAKSESKSEEKGEAKAESKEAKSETKSEEKGEAKSEEKTEEKKGGREFNRDAARNALAGAAGAASGCSKPGGPTGRGRVTVTFAPSGRATTANVSPPFAGTAVGSCAAGAFKGASVPPFDGGAVTVSKSFFIK